MVSRHWRFYGFFMFYHFYKVLSFVLSIVICL